MNTTIENKISILADVFITKKNDLAYSEFVSFNDIGLPLCYLISENLVSYSEQAKGFIEDTFDNLLELYGIEDAGFKNLAEMDKP